MARADTLPLKAINQYRSRDVFAYLALRYCVENIYAKTNKWSENNAVQIVLGSHRGTYLRSYHFKAPHEDGTIEHRELMIPGANETLAESALLAACAKACKSRRSDNSFSYILSSPSDRRYFFEPYMDGLRRRQEAIMAACQQTPDGTVVYVDVKKFYPSISINLARSVWKKFCDEHEIGEKYRYLGSKIIYNYSLEGEDCILTGPMFSHFLANLVFEDVDYWSKTLPVSYMRYVDDLTLVGDSSDISQALAGIRQRLADIGLNLHSEDSEKTLSVSCTDWLDSAKDFQQGPHSVAWMKLIGDIKKLLIFKREEADDIADAFRIRGFRLPLPDYAIAVGEATTFERVRELGLWGWLWLKTRKTSLTSILKDAETLRLNIFQETESMLKRPRPADPFQRKRLVSKLRYRLGRLLYLAQPEQLQKINSALAEWPELFFHKIIIDSFLTKDCSLAVEAGSNVAQATAQIFRASLETAKFSRPVAGDIMNQGLAIFILNGVSVEAEIRSEQNPLLRFARGPIDRELMKQPRGLLQELACLHGMSGDVRHPEIMSTAFDVDQEIFLDALEFDYGYYL